MIVCGHLGTIECFVHTYPLSFTEGRRRDVYLRRCHFRCLVGLTRDQDDHIQVAPSRRVCHFRRAFVCRPPRMPAARGGCLLLIWELKHFANKAPHDNGDVLNTTTMALFGQAMPKYFYDEISDSLIG